MKSLRVHSHESRGKEVKHRQSLRKSNTPMIERPTLLDFDAFIPWFCLELQVTKNIVVTRTNQEQYTRYGTRTSKESSKSIKLRTKSMKIKSGSIKSVHTDDKTCELKKSSIIPNEDAVPVTTYYDKRGRLVEIAIIGCAFPVPRKLIKAFNICLPFHLELYKLSIRKGGLNNSILYEIGKLLPHSNITDVCLDDSYIPGGNYSKLLEQPSQIKYLSLKRCGIDDEECKHIADKLHFNGIVHKHLLALDLTSNNITDEGAKALGEALKTNRCLLYLNASGNNISDIGAAYILKYLKEFPLAFYDIRDRWIRKCNYLKTRQIIYEKSLEEAKLARLLNDVKIDDHSIFDHSKQAKRRKTKSRLQSFFIGETTIEEDAEKKTNEIVGEFEHPFQEEHIKYEGNLAYAIGNLTLCFLNLAYNNITLLSIRKIVDVLKYQSGINKTSKCTGLLKIVLDGNSIPSNCYELDEIDILLQGTILKADHHLSLLSFKGSSAVSSIKRVDF